MKIKTLALTLFLCLAFAFTATANPILVTFVGPQQNVTNANGVYVGPYSLLLDSDPIFATCISFDQHVAGGETWLADLEPLSYFTPAQQISLLKAQYLNGAFAFYPDWVGIHQAIWNIFGATFATSEGGAQTPTGYWVNEANTNYLSVNPTSFNVLVPENGSQIPLSMGLPQSFLINTQGHSEVPEPMSFILIGSGLVGLSLMGRKRLQKK